jgi:hypothetical protein
MATHALDVITILSALRTLEQELQGTGWQPQNAAQKELFAWLETYQEQLARMTGLEAKASRFYEELNAFLAEKGFSLRLEPFDPVRGLGVVSVLDKLVRWLQGPGTKSDIVTRRGAMPGFDLPDTGVRIYEVEGYRGSYLLELLTQSEETLWLFVHADPSLEGLDLVKLSLDVMRRSRHPPVSYAPGAGAAPPLGGANDSLIQSLVKRVLSGLRPARQTRLATVPGARAYPTFAGARIPMIDFDLTADLDWLLGAVLFTVSPEPYRIEQAKQQFKLRMDETGARVKVATAMVAGAVSLHYGPTIFIVDRPFYGWWTQRGVDVPMAAFFADWDCWRKPAGALEDL